MESITKSLFQSRKDGKHDTRRHFYFYFFFVPEMDPVVWLIFFILRDLQGRVSHRSLVQKGVIFRADAILYKTTTKEEKKKKEKNHSFVVCWTISWLAGTNAPRTNECTALWPHLRASKGKPNTSFRENARSNFFFFFIWWSWASTMGSQVHS